MKNQLSLFLALVLTFGISMAPTFAAAPQKSLRIENYNVVLVSGNKKIDTLTTKGNVSADMKGTVECSVISTDTCVAYEVIKSTGTYGLISRRSLFKDTDSDRKDIFLYRFGVKNSKLINISSRLNGKYGIQSLITFYMEQEGKDTKIVAHIDTERGMSPEQARSYGYQLGKNTGTTEYPIYESATLTVPASFFLSIK